MTSTSSNNYYHAAMEYGSDAGSFSLTDEIESQVCEDEGGSYHSPLVEEDEESEDFVPAGLAMAFADTNAMISQVTADLFTEELLVNKDESTDTEVESGLEDQMGLENSKQDSFVERGDDTGMSEKVSQDVIGDDGVLAGRDSVKADGKETLLPDEVMTDKKESIASSASVLDADSGGTEVPKDNPLATFVAAMTAEATNKIPPAPPDEEDDLDIQMFLPNSQSRRISSRKSSPISSSKVNGKKSVTKKCDEKSGTTKKVTRPSSGGMQTRSQAKAKTANPHLSTSVPPTTSRLGKVSREARSATYSMTRSRSINPPPPPEMQKATGSKAKTKTKIGQSPLKTAVGLAKGKITSMTDKRKSSVKSAAASLKSSTNPRKFLSRGGAKIQPILDSGMNGTMKPQRVTGTKKKGTASHHGPESLDPVKSKVSSTPTTATITNNTTKKSSPYARLSKLSSRMSITRNDVKAKSEQRAKDREAQRERLREIMLNRNKQPKSSVTTTAAPTRKSADVSVKRKTTVPKGPRLSTRLRMGQKSATTHGKTEDDKDTETNLSLSSAKTPRTLTVPKAPRLSTGLRHGDKLYSTNSVLKCKDDHVNGSFLSNAPLESPQSLTFAESMDLYNRKYLRESPLISHAHSAQKLARITAPNLSTPTASPRTYKSRQQLEEEMVDYIKTHQFKAKPISRGVMESHGDHGVPRKPPRQVTTPSPFRLRTEERHGNDPTPLNTDDLLSAECAKQFHALPLPDRNYRPPSVVKLHFQRQTTTPSPFRLSSEPRHSNTPLFPPTPDDVELAKSFHARPMPDLTYKGIRSNQKEPSRRLTNPRSPNLSISNREKRHSLTNAAKSNVMAKMKQKIAEHRRRQKQHITSSASHSTPGSSPRVTVPSPFQLHTECRGEHYRSTLREKLHQEEEARNRLSQVKARPLPSNHAIAPKISPSHRGTTSPAPFQIDTCNRHESHKKALLEKIEQEERELKRLSTSVKALPLPRSLYAAPPQIKRNTEAPTVPESPPLQTVARTNSRKSFSQNTLRKKKEENRKKMDLEHEKKLKEESLLKELRRTSVDQGGYMQLAKPINSIFSELRITSDKSRVSRGSMSHPSPTAQNI